MKTQAEQDFRISLEEDQRLHDMRIRFRCALQANVKSMREERNLSIQQLARATGIHHSQLATVEDTRRSVSDRVLVALATYFNVRVGELYRATGP